MNETDGDKSTYKHRARHKKNIKTNTDTCKYSLRHTGIVSETSEQPFRDAGSLRERDKRPTKQTESDTQTRKDKHGNMNQPYKHGERETHKTCKCTEQDTQSRTQKHTNIRSDTQA